MEVVSSTDDDDDGRREEDDNDGGSDVLSLLSMFVSFSSRLLWLSKGEEKIELRWRWCTQKDDDVIRRRRWRREECVSVDTFNRLSQNILFLSFMSADWRMKASRVDKKREGYNHNKNNLYLDEDGWKERRMDDWETVKEIENEMSSRDETGKHVRLACSCFFVVPSSSKQKWEMMMIPFLLLLHITLMLLSWSVSPLTNRLLDLSLTFFEEDTSFPFQSFGEKGESETKVRASDEY